MKLKDKVTIITGAARGIGLACAERFHAEGAKLILGDIDDEAGKVAAARFAGALYRHCHYRLYQMLHYRPAGRARQGGGDRQGGRRGEGRLWPVGGEH